MSEPACPRAWELDAYREGSLSEGDALSFERHLRSCPACAASRVSNERLRALAQRLADDGPDALGLRRLRRRILDDAAIGPPHPRAPRAGLWIALACLATAMGAWALGQRGEAARAPSVAATAPSAAATPGPPGPLAGTVTPTEKARWSQTRTGDVERVRLDEGTVSVHVRPQLPRERFLVEMPDGEIEVRGTTFEVTVEAGRTTGVRVLEGVVELRLTASPPQRLEAGDSFSSPLGAAVASVAPVATPLPRSAPKAEAAGAHVVVAAEPDAGATAIPGGDDGTAAYAEALGFLSAGRNEQAATALRAFVEAYPNAAQAEDATFLEAVALARAGRTDAAGLAAEHHLTRFPGSFHRKDALVLVERAARLRAGTGASP